MADDLIQKLAERVGNGITWLVDHDPKGRFHLWFQARILPGAAAPGQTPEDMAEYRAYYKARVQWERLNAELLRLEKAAESASPL